MNSSMNSRGVASRKGHPLKSIQLKQEIEESVERVLVTRGGMEKPSDSLMSAVKQLRTSLSRDVTGRSRQDSSQTGEDSPFAQIGSQDTRKKLAIPQQSTD